MSSESRAEPCSDVQAGETEHVKEKKETEEVPCENKQPTRSQRQEELEAGQTLSPDCDGKQEVTSKGLCTVKLHKSKPRRLLTFSHLTRNKKKPPGFFIGGTNGTQIVRSYCEGKGWKTVDKTNGKDFRLVWCGKSQAIYSQFREGQYLLYQIPNNNELTNKISLLSNLRLHERLSSQVECNDRFRRLKMEEFIPTTFRMDMRKERETFFDLFKQNKEKSESSMWICKPSGQDQGKGILLLKNQEDVMAFRLKLQQMEDNWKPLYFQSHPYIAQRYIQNPLLLKSRKFDIRSFLVIACTDPYMVFFRHGYVRLSCENYDANSENLSIHLTNQCVQMKNPLYSQLKEDTVWSMESFNDYINDTFQVARGLPRDWVLGALTKRMQQIMTQCFFAVKSKLDRRLGFFDLIGCDFLVDQDFKVWLLEMNCNPALQTNCEVLKKVIPSTIMETLDLSLEIFNKRRLRQNILPLITQQYFVLLYSGSTAVRPPLPLNRVSISESVAFPNRSSSTRAEVKIHLTPLKAAKGLKKKATQTDCSAVCSPSSKGAKRKKKKRKTMKNGNKLEKNKTKQKNKPIKD